MQTRCIAGLLGHLELGGGLLASQEQGAWTWSPAQLGGRESKLQRAAAGSLISRGLRGGGGQVGSRTLWGGSSV